MPRYYRKRYTRVIRPKKKWATNLVDIAVAPQINANTALFVSRIAVNSAPSSNPTPTIVKTGNFKLQCDASFQLSATSQVEYSAYVMYVPEGMDTQVVGFTNAEAFITKHPEWILCWKFGSYDYIGTGGGNVDSIKVSSRLKRNLNSGDGIYYIALAKTTSTVTITSAASSGKCQYWTCAN